MSISHTEVGRGVPPLTPRRFYFFLKSNVEVMVKESGSHIGGKRIRSEDDEVYLDNYHSNKRYLTELISSSLSGLAVSDSVPDLAGNPQPTIQSLEIPNQCESSRSLKYSSIRSQWDDLSILDSVMSDDSDDNSQDHVIRENGTPNRTPISISDSLFGSPASPASPDKLGSIQEVPNSTRKLLYRSYSFPNSSSPNFSCSLPKYRSDSQGHLPPSPSDPCQPADLRRAALLRALQMHALPPGRLAPELLTGRREEARVLKFIDDDEKSSSPVLLASHEEISEMTDDVGSPVHGIFTAHVSRGSTRARSLHLDD